ncbi:family 2 glycosyltransferase [Melampsora larici-populina 98AG31]|uniref:dolichyl-phosphate beta-glucosyltransferase n=1 Tax=Melampsora larici-populina (strain 98AG31 / pathotype 3-4-7) TaxID=747676 RepID=F4S9K3_MELLP|nr:family 2 glycosyltransferase [Melampsora larici-populina 98AG31]EGF98653.1 family 2 glycosyltransferase [Melampsora larici-populina 98AG31]
MWNLILSILFLLPILYYTLILTLRYISPNPLPPTPESLNYLSTEQPNAPGLPLKSIQEPSTLDLSVVIPAYNEENRLKVGLKSALDYLPTLNQSYEVLIIDDGSQDQTVQEALQLAFDHQALLQSSNPKVNGEIRVIRLGKNRGKGGAVKHGILFSRGQRILFADADGASDFSDHKLLNDQLNQIILKTESTQLGMSIGSRAHLISTQPVVSRSQFRNFLMKAFHLYLYLLGLRDIRDTQCGFKLLTRDSARDLFNGLHVEGWIFDVELLLLAKLMNPPIPIAEVPITWNEVSGSKLSIIKDSITMAIELLIIRLNYLLGVWKVPKSSSLQT